MRNFWLILSVLWLWTCSGGGDKATGPEEPPIVINLTYLGGQAQKGPFNNGTSINVAELSNTLSPTGRNFSSAITDNTGRFAVANVQLESPYVELRANGFYFNEVSNEISDAQLTLFAISNLTGKTSLNVNILTHLEKNRMVTLMSGDNPKTFAQAKLQAQEEVLAIFDYSRANVPESELLDISQDGAANAKLLAMSAIIQGDLTVGQMSQLLANISTDIASDGTLDDTNLRNTLIENSKNLDMEEVRSNLVAHYTSLGISATIPDFESEINQFLKPPVANDMSASTGEDTSINITLAGSDPEGESLTYTILEVNNATVTLNGNVANYNPDANFNGTDTFTYYANDGISDSNIATVTMTVSAEDDDPNTQNAAATTDEDVAVELQLTAEEYDGDSYSFGIISQPTNGSVSLDGVNATYTPNQDYNGTDSFTFEATDDTGRMMNVGTATITINPVNDAPVLVTTSVTESVNEEESIDITITATDVDGDQLTFQDATMDENGNEVVTDGTISINGNVYTYTLGSDIELSEGQTYGDSFYYYANDNSGEKNAYGFATITTVGVDDLPHAEDKYVATPENSSVDILLSSIDPDGGDNSNIQYEITSSPTNGSVVLNDALATYTPNTDFHGDDTFQYKVTGDNIIATVDIGVNEVVGTVKLYPDLISGYDESFSDILFDESTNGYIVTGMHREPGDDGGTTYGLISLATNSNLSSTNHQIVSNFDLNGAAWPSPKTDRQWGYDISKNSNNGEYIIFRSNGSDRIALMSSNSGLMQLAISMQNDWPDNSNNPDNPGTILQTSNGYVLHTETRGRDAPSGCSFGSETFPSIVKIDLQGNFQYHLAVDFEDDDSKYYRVERTGAVVEAEADVYYMVAQVLRCGFSDRELVLIKVTDTGSSFTLDNIFEMPNINNNSKLNDQGWANFVVHESSNSLFKFSLLIGSNSSEATIASYEIQNPNLSSSTVNNLSTYSFNTNGQTNIGMAGEGSNLYIAFNGGSDNNQQTDIVIGKFDSSSNLIWSKQADVQGSGSIDIFGGITLNNDGVAITGYTKAYNVGNTPGDRNGFILLLDSNGD